MKTSKPCVQSRIQNIRLTSEELHHTETNLPLRSGVPPYQGRKLGRGQVMQGAWFCGSGASGRSLGVKFDQSLNFMSSVVRASLWMTQASSPPDGPVSAGSLLLTFAGFQG